MRPVTKRGHISPLQDQVLEKKLSVIIGQRKIGKGP